MRNEKFSGTKIYILFLYLKRRKYFKIGKYYTIKSQNTHQNDISKYCILGKHIFEMFMKNDGAFPLCGTHIKPKLEYFK